MNEEAEKTLSSRLGDYFCQCFVVVIIIGGIGIYLFLEFFGPFPLPPLLEHYVTIIGAATVFILLLIVLPIGIILGIIYDRRKKTQMQSSAPVEKRHSAQESHERVLTHCPTCNALLQGEEQFCPGCGVAITNSTY